MPPIIDLSGLTMNTEEAQQVSEAIFEKFLNYSEISKYHEIQTGITHDQQIPFVGVLGLVGKAITKCAPDANGNQVPITEKTWSPKLLGDRFEHCAIDLNPLLKLFKKASKITPDFYDRIGSEELGVVVTRIEEAMEAMVSRNTWFGDTAAETIANLGVYKNSTDVDFYNIYDGLFKQLFAEITAGSPYHVDIPENDGATYADQKNDPELLDEDYAYKLFRKMLNKRDARFKQVAGMGVEPVFHSTSALVENFVDYLETKSLAFTLQRAEDEQIQEVRYRKMVIVPRYDWDATIAEQDNGTVLNLPHRVLLTSKENIPIGTVSESDLATLKSFYYEYGQKNVMDFAAKLDAKFLEDYMAVFAY